MTWRDAVLPSATIDVQADQAQPALVVRREAVPHDQAARLGHQAAPAGLGVRPVADLGLVPGLDAEGVDGTDEQVGAGVGQRPGDGAPGSRGPRCTRTSTRVPGGRVGLGRCRRSSRRCARRRRPRPSGRRRRARRRPQHHCCPVTRGACSQSVRGARSSSTCSTPTQPSSSSPRWVTQRGTVPSQLKPSRHAARREAQLPPFAHQITARSRCSLNPQSSSSRSARSMMPRPRAHGCAPKAISARRLPSSRSSTVPQNRGTPSSSVASTAKAQRCLDAQPTGHRR